jgi:hypothetical protein
LNVLQDNQLNVEKIKEYIASMKEAVEIELCKPNLGKKKDIFLKARLKNYMLLSAFLSSPERARKQLEGALTGIVKKRF